MPQLKLINTILKSASFLVALVFFIPRCVAQTPGVEKSFVQAFDQYRSQFIQEKLFVHTDKDVYISREICWFRIFYVDAFYNRPATLSKIAYVEILDRNNQAVIQQKVSLKPGESHGSFLVPVNIPSGTYRFRAYTNWMKNFGANYFFEKAIRIINPQNLNADSSLSKVKHFDLQFFPEGGKLVQNITSKVAFRVTDDFGKGLDCEGILLNENNDTVLRFRPTHLGIGNFIFKPGSGESYKAMIRFPDGQQISKSLPVISAEGLVMSIIKTNEDELKIDMKSSGSMNGENIFIFIHGSHTALRVRETKLEDQQAVATVKISDLEDGISVFTLFNQNAQPLCERLYFKYPEKKLLIGAALNPEYESRRKIDLGISTADQSGKSLTADLSLAVYRLDSLQSPEELNIRNYMYLNAELGFVEHPAFYFSDSLKDREADMDNLMLTHGWRRFVWKELMNKKMYTPVFPPEMNGHIIQGKLVNNTTGVAVNAISTYLSVPSTRTEFRVTDSGPDGHVKYEMPGFYGSQEIILQTNPNEDSVSHVEIVNPFTDQFNGTPLPEFPRQKYSTVLQDRTIAEQVQYIYNGSKLNHSVLQEVDSNTFYVVPDEKYYLDNYVRFQTMEEVIREYVVSTSVSIKKNKFQLRLVNKPLRELFNDLPLILIDGVPFFDANELFQQDPMKIRRLDLVNREYAFGYKYFAGVINLTTYQGDLNGILLNTRPTVLDYPGIPEQREFFSPEYETEDQVNSRMPDYRTLLYWSPEIKTYEQAKKMISFYSSDLPGKYAVVLMGLTKDGVPGSVTHIFTVKK